ncbi:MAG: hypothetical protein RIT45_3764 [Pseudomonadota bacterium]|jgi:hypothetical protein
MFSTTRLATLASLALTIALTGCDKPAPTPAAGAAAPQTPQAAAPIGLAGGEANQEAAAPAGGKQYSVVVKPLTLKNGEKKVATIRIEPAKGLKFNADFPTKFVATAAANAKSEKDKLSVKEGDVKIEDKVGVLSVPVLATAVGKGSISLQGRFSVCSDEQCYVMQETIALAVEVQ